jgi:hypothetical protein
MNDKARKKLVRNLIIDAGFMFMMSVALSNFIFLFTVAGDGPTHKLEAFFGAILSIVLGVFFTCRVQDHFRELGKR